MDFLSCRELSWKQISNGTVYNKFGHTKRISKARWPREVLEWVLPEQREGGQPLRSWRNDCKGTK